MRRPLRMLFRGQSGVPPYEYFVRDPESARVLAELLDEAAMERWAAQEPDENNPFPADGEVTG